MDSRKKELRWAERRDSDVKAWSDENDDEASFPLLETCSCG